MRFDFFPIKWSAVANRLLRRERLGGEAAAPTQSNQGLRMRRLLLGVWSKARFDSFFECGAPPPPNADQNIGALGDSCT